MHNAILGKSVVSPSRSNYSLDDVLEESLCLGLPLLTNELHSIVVTLGAHGVLLITTLAASSPFPTRESVAEVTKPQAIYYPAPKTKDLISVSGAGDCFAAGMIASIVLGLEPNHCIYAGQRAAALSLHSHLAVPNTINSVEVFNFQEPIQKRSIL
ncbi:hypothetical protein X975_08855, partial [Stegodyphus mimosarum]